MVGFGVGSYPSTELKQAISERGGNRGEGGHPHGRVVPEVRAAQEAPGTVSRDRGDTARRVCWVKTS